jgi:Bacterial Ig-like domain
MTVKQLCLGILIIFLGACGGTSTPDPEPNPTDKTAPKLESSIPKTGTSNVPINVKLAFLFNEAMAEGSLELSSTPALTLGNPKWATTGIAFENEALAASTPYTLTLNAKDVSGNALAQTTITFTTSDSADTTAPSTPTGLVATPANGQVTLTWQANPESDVAGYTVYSGTTQDALESTTFVTETTKTMTGLTNDTTYFFALDAVDVANNHSSKTAPVSATPSTMVTDTTPPTIQSSDPADSATDVNPRNLKIKLVFSEPMDKATFSLTFMPPDPFPAIISKVVEPAATTPFKVSWSEEDTVATLDPTEELLRENITFTLALIAKDKAGNALSGDSDISFTTGKEPLRLVSSTPENGATNVPAPFSELVRITLTFSEAINPTTFQSDNNFPYGCEDPVWEAGNLTVNFDCTLRDENTYTLFYGGHSLTGEVFEDSISFSTIPDAAPPSVRSSFPLDNATGVGLGTLIAIAFDDEMDEASTLAAVSSSAPLGCTWELNGPKDTLRCSPANLQGNTTYTVTVSEAAKDTSGKNLVGSGLCRGAPPCSYTFEFSTIITSTVGDLRVNISGAPTNLAKVRVTGPGGFSGVAGSSKTFTDLMPGTYTITAQGFSTGQPNKPTCRIYTPTPLSQTETVTAGQTASASVSYTSESCAPDAP